ncbi:uncharacterized protein LOC129319806 [Prosopis cineraria]|uniref:uncharacterized protein LOC129319806 n=1 Tax=Prosopis cineraria TaxID=364024 RepID=UPI00240F7FDE|nr:uncharacterized protein LOC129319806 [Prosopis cineraria]
MAAPTRNSRAPVLRSLSPSGRFCNSRYSSPPVHPLLLLPIAQAFLLAPQPSCPRSTSPTRVNLCGSSAASAPSVRLSVDRSNSLNRSISVTPRSGSANGSKVVKKPSQQKRTCLCSPTTHPGSFRCSLHKAFASRSVAPYSPNKLNARRSAMTNSLVGICGVDGNLVNRALSAMIRPSSHQQRRRADFQPRPSRLSVMSKAEGS